MLQEADISKQQAQHEEDIAKLQSQLRKSQAQVAHLEAQLSPAAEAASSSQTMQSSQLQKLSEQHSSMLRQLRHDHEMQLKAASDHHEVPVLSLLNGIDALVCNAVLPGCTALL